MGAGQVAPSSFLAIVQRVISGWNRFWFSPGDPTTLGFVRICAGLMVLYIHLCYSFDLEAFMSRDAWMDQATVDSLRHEQPFYGPSLGWDEPPKTDAQTPEDKAYIQKWGGSRHRAVSIGGYQWSIWFHVGDPRWMWPIHIAILVIMLCFTLGLCTRITAVLTWLAILSYINRGPTTVFGMDTIQNLVVFYLMIGPSGAALSLDRLIRRRLAIRRARQAHERLPQWTRPAPTISANFAMRLLQVNVCMVYLVSGLSKLLGQSWWNGNAIWLTMANPEFSPLGYKYYIAFLRLLGEHRWLYEIIVPSLTLGTLVFEISFVFLVWQRRFRWLVLASGVFLHVGIAFFMGLVPFSMMMLVALSAFFPSATLRDLFARLLGRDEKLRLVPAAA
jgi:hypothetical protein